MKKKSCIVITLIFTLTISMMACGKNDEPNHVEIPEQSADKVTVTKEFVESMKIIPNPERGLYTYKEFVTGETYMLTTDEVKRYRNEQSITLFYTVYYMPDFRDKPISGDYLKRIKANMQALRDGGGKAILRFSYTKSEKDKPWDAPWNITKGHIEQLAPVFKEYMDVISVLQAGFIGVWGEWYYTDNYIFEPGEKDYGPRKQVLDALLKSLPEERMVCIRYPKAKINILGISHSDSITVAEAFNGSDRSRIAGHNDCFLADEDDTGTFGGNLNHRKYWENESKYYAMGGETCGLSSYSECANAMDNFRKYHWSYLNIDYKIEVLNDWKLKGCFDEIQRLLGYRIVLQKIEYEPEAAIGEMHEMTLTLKNRGWASPYNPRDVEIIISSANGRHKEIFKLDEDPRFWFTGNEITIHAEMKLSSDMKKGIYNVYLNLPDPTDTLSSKPEFSIQCANTGVWSDSTGYNKLYELKVK